MQEGYTGSLEYIDGAGGWLGTAWLEKTDVNWPGIPGQSTTDPSWLVVNRDGGPVMRTEWLWYRNPAGIYKAKIHCQYYGASGPHSPAFIRTWFEHERPNGDHNHDGYLMDFMDWEGRWWRAEIQDVLSWPAPPQFYVRRL